MNLILGEVEETIYVVETSDDNQDTVKVSDSAESGLLGSVAVTSSARCATGPASV